MQALILQYLPCGQEGEGRVGGLSEISITIQDRRKFFSCLAGRTQPSVPAGHSIGLYWKKGDMAGNLAVMEEWKGGAYKVGTVHDWNHWAGGEYCWMDVFNNLNMIVVQCRLGGECICFLVIQESIVRFFFNRGWIWVGRQWIEHEIFVGFFFLEICRVFSICVLVSILFQVEQIWAS